MTDDSLIEQIEAEISHAVKHKWDGAYVTGMRDALELVRRHTPAGREGDAKCTCRNARRTVQNKCPVHFAAAMSPVYAGGDGVGVARHSPASCAMSPVGREGDVERVARAICLSVNDFDDQQKWRCYLKEARAALAAVPKPVPVSLERCAEAVRSTYQTFHMADNHKVAKAVLEAAGIPYTEQPIEGASHED